MRIEPEMEEAHRKPLHLQPIAAEAVQHDGLGASDRSRKGFEGGSIQALDHASRVA